jgi:RecA-family ATPase
MLVDNASDAYGGDEIQRRQVRAFIRALVDIARLNNCAVMLLAHVDKVTSHNKKAEGAKAIRVLPPGTTAPAAVCL